MTDLSPSPDKPEPCTQAAREEGCTCRMETVHSVSIDPPEPILDPWCPVHGKDPDAEYERQRDDAVWDTTYERDMDFDD